MASPAEHLIMQDIFIFDCPVSRAPTLALAVTSEHFLSSCSVGLWGAASSSCDTVQLVGNAMHRAVADALVWRTHRATPSTDGDARVQGSVGPDCDANLGDFAQDASGFIEGAET